MVVLVVVLLLVTTAQLQEVLEILHQLHHRKVIMVAIQQIQQRKIEVQLVVVVLQPQVLIHQELLAAQVEQEQHRLSQEPQ
jgi:hypothetical protein